MIQSGNWRGARDPARELEGASDNRQNVNVLAKY